MTCYGALSAASPVEAISSQPLGLLLATSDLVLSNRFVGVLNLLREPKKDGANLRRVCGLKIQGGNVSNVSDKMAEMYSRRNRPQIWKQNSEKEDCNRYKQANYSTHRNMFLVCWVPEKTVHLSKMALVTLLGTSGACPDVIFSNFGSTPPGYDALDGGWAPNRAQVCFFPGFCFIQDNEMAMGFSVPMGSTFEFTGFEVPLNFSPSFSNGITNVDFTLAAADASGKPGTPLETITIDGLTISPMVYTGNSVLHPILTGGNYFLEAAIASGDFGEAGWNFANSANASGPVSGMSSPFAPPGWGTPGGNQVQAAFEIDGIAVPEPCSVGLLAGVLGIFALSRRSHN